MLQVFRRAKSSWFVVAFLGIVMVAFVITGIERRAPGPTADAEWLARVDGEAVTVSDLNEELDRELNRFRQEQQQPELDMATFVRSGAFDQILERMIADRAVSVFAREQGLTVSEQMVNREIASVPVFQNLAGQFEDMRLRQWLAQEKKTEQSLREEIEMQMLQRQLLAPVGSAAQAPEKLARRYAALLLETRSGTVGVVPTASVGSGAEPTDAEVAAYYRRNQARYTIPERRILRYALIGSQDVAAAAQATDAEVEAAYRANAAQFAPKESRRLSQVVLPSQAAAQAFAAKVAGGASFAQAASEAGFSSADTAIGETAREELASRFTAAVADAAFAAAEGAVTAPIQSPLGWHVIRVEDVVTAPAQPLAAVRDELARQIEERKATDALLTLVTRIEDEIGNGASFEEVTRQHGLTAQQTAPITASGAAPGVAGYQLPAEVGALLRTGFDLSEDDDPVVETVTPNQRFAVMTLAETIPAAAPPLAQIADRVKSDLAADRASARARAVAQSILAKVNSGMPIAQAFAEADVSLPAVRPVSARRMDAARQEEGVSAPLRAVFTTPAGKAKMVAAPNGAGWFIVRTDEVTPGDVSNAPGLAEATRAQLSQVFGQEYGRQFIRAIERGMEVERNPAAIARLKADLLRGVAQ